MLCIRGLLTAVTGRYSLLGGGGVEQFSVNEVGDGRWTEKGFGVHCYVDVSVGVGGELGMLRSLTGMLVRFAG